MPVLRWLAPRDPLTPEQLEVAITYRVPEPVANKLVAGACFKAIHDVMEARLVTSWSLPRNGGRTPCQ